LFPFSAFSGESIDHAQDQSTKASITVMGKQISHKELGASPEKAVRSIILTALLKNFTKQNNIVISDEEMAKAKEFFNTSMKDAMQDMDEEFLTGFEMPEFFIKEQIVRWKTNKALYDKYGGRVRFQQMGPEPLDAYKAFLKENEKNKSFIIHDEALKEAFWSYYNTQSSHHFYSDEVGKEIMSKPIWEHKESF
jgi:hypothetical protein